jgi:hypothetical protein
MNSENEKIRVSAKFLISSSTMKRGDKYNIVLVLKAVIKTAQQFPVCIVDQHQNSRSTAQSGLIRKEREGCAMVST